MLCPVNKDHKRLQLHIIGHGGANGESTELNPSEDSE